MHSPPSRQRQHELLVFQQQYPRTGGRAAVEALCACLLMIVLVLLPLVFTVGGVLLGIRGVLSGFSFGLNASPIRHGVHGLRWTLLWGAAFLLLLWWKKSRIAVTVRRVAMGGDWLMSLFDIWANAQVRRRPGGFLAGVHAYFRVAVAMNQEASPAGRG